MDKLLAGVESRRQGILTHRPSSIDASLPQPLTDSIAMRVRRAEDEGLARRIWAKDPTVWGEAGTPEIADRLELADDRRNAMLEQADSLVEFAEACAAEGFTDAVLLGMGGSSLAPEVLWRTFGAPHEALALHVLDTTDPAAIAELSSSLTSRRPCSSCRRSPVARSRRSRSSSTSSRSDPAGASSSPSPIPAARSRRSHASTASREVFENDPNIGGRYSALSLFGLVPAALIGAPVHALLERAAAGAQTCSHVESSTANPGLWLGLALGELALHGHDKLTLVIGEPVASFGLWAEQLVAESTGKHGRGIVPIADEPLCEPEHYGPDRVFLHVRDPEHVDTQTDARIASLRALGIPRSR